MLLRLSRLRSFFAVFAVASIVMFISGCGSNSSSPTQATDTPVTKTVGAAGGTVLATASGVKISLSIPAGALPSDTAVSITPLTPVAGDVVSVRLAPGGIIFAKPVTVVLEYPAGQAPNAKASLRQRLGTEDSYLVTTVDTAARTLSARLTTFGGTALDTLAQPAAVSASAPAKLARTLLAKVLANPVPPGDGTLSASNTTTAEMLASARRIALIMEIEGNFASAFALQSSIASLIMRRGDVDFPADAMTFLNEAHDTACTALGDAVTKAHTAPVTKLADFKPLREKLGNWWFIADSGDVNNRGCPNVGIETIMDAAVALTQREIDMQKLKLPVVKTPTEIKEPSEAVKVARRAKRDLEALQAAADILNVPPVQKNTAKTPAKQVRALATGGAATYAGIIQTNLLDPLVTPAREAAWTVAKGSQSLAQYPTVMDAFGGVPALSQDVQFVRTRIEVRVNSAGGDTISSSVLGFDSVPDKPTDPKRSDSLTVDKAGTLAISGTIANLECASAGTETLKVTFDNAEVATVSAGGGNLLAGALSTFTPTGLLQAAGLPPADTGTHTLRVRRSGSPCATELGITDDLLATVTLSFNERRIYFSRYPHGIGSDGTGNPGGMGIESVKADGTGRAVVTVNGLSQFCAPDGDGAPPSCYMDGNAHDSQPTLSPDGSQIAFSRPDAIGAGNPDGIMLASANGGGIRELSNQGLELDHSPSWSPDGRRLAYVRDPQTDQPKTLWVVNADGSGAVQLASTNGFFSGTAWSPDGTAIAYGGDGGSSSTVGLYTVAADGSSPPSRLDSGYYSFVSASAWSPDGKKITFGYGRIVNADGTGLTQLPPRFLQQSPFAWSPDGSEFAFIDCPNYVCAIYAMSPDGERSAATDGRRCRGRG